MVTIIDHFKLTGLRRCGIYVFAVAAFVAVVVAVVIFVVDVVVDVVGAVAVLL